MARVLRLGLMVPSTRANTSKAKSMERAL
jgi:hypothetical protein